MPEQQTVTHAAAPVRPRRWSAAAARLVALCGLRRVWVARALRAQLATLCTLELSRLASDLYVRVAHIVLPYEVRMCVGFPDAPQSRDLAESVLFMVL